MPFEGGFVDELGSLGGPQQLQLLSVPGPSDKRNQYLNVKSLSMDSQKSSASSRGSDTSPGMKSLGGSYSAATGASSKLLAQSLKLPPGSSAQQPKLAQVAAQLLKAKREGQLPSAFGDITLPGTKLPEVNGSAQTETAVPANPPIEASPPSAQNKFLAAAQQIKAQQAQQNAQSQRLVWLTTTNPALFFN